MLEKTLGGHGLEVRVTDGEDVDALYAAVREMVLHEATAVVCSARCARESRVRRYKPRSRRPCCTEDGCIFWDGKSSRCRRQLSICRRPPRLPTHRLSTYAGRNPNTCELAKLLSKCSAPCRQKSKEVMVIDSDLGGSTNFNGSK